LVFGEAMLCRSCGEKIIEIIEWVDVRMRM